MSMELHVLLKDANLPNLEQWQKAITSEGFDLILDSTRSIRECKGALPAVYKGKETGFEFDIFPATSITEAYSHISSMIGDRNISANFRFGGNETEGIAASIASAVLTKLADGVLYEPDAGDFFQNESAIQMAKDTIKAFEES